MPEWADVWVPRTEDRTALAGRALFFVPTALDRLTAVGITQAVLNRHAAALKLTSQSDGEHIAGRAVIEHVMLCTPVVYRSAIGFLTVANAALSARNSGFQFTTRDIVACVFRLRDIPDVVKALGTTAEAIAKACRIKPRIVQSTLQRYRISYVHADAIWRHLFQVKGAAGTKAQEIESLTDNPSDFIRTDTRHAGRMSIQRIEAGSASDPFEICVYEREDLQPAATSGHSWAID